MGCPDLTTDLTRDEARAILEPYFEAAREKFTRFGFGKVKRTRFSCSSDMHDTPRHFAGTSTNGLVVKAAPELAEVDESIVIAIMAHELGHATDFLYPGEFVLGKGESLMRRDRDQVDERQWGRWLSQWQKRDDYVVEKTADLIAGEVWGTPIGYIGPCMLETFQGGVPRPVALR